MDHVVLPRNSNQLRISVPYCTVEGVSYGDSEWATFPQRNDLTTSHGILTFSELQKRPPEFRVAFVQAWLYFGLLRTVLQCSKFYNRRCNLRGDDSGSADPSNHVKFVRDDAGVESGARLCTEDLPAMIEQKYQEIWSKVQIETSYIPPGPDSDGGTVETIYYTAVDEEKSRILKILSQAMLQCDYLDRPCDVTGWSETMLAIKILIASLSVLGDSHRHMEPFKKLKDPKTNCTTLVQAQYDMREALTRTRSHAASLQLLRQHQVQRSGWCIHHFRAVSTDVSILTMYYLANIQRFSRRTEGHDSCGTHKSCVAHNIDDRTFKSAHTTEDCDCIHVFAPFEKMHRILRTGGIPVVKCQISASGDMVLSYVRAAPQSRYAAISHLWADGLGNPHSHSLPKCQLQALYQQILKADKLAGISRSPQKSFQTVYFWLDVFCVPTAASNAEEESSGAESTTEGTGTTLKDVALSRMAGSYSWASYVLVLDNELMEIKLREDPIESLARIGISSWNSRCWTYQELCLGRRVIFQGADEPWFPNEPSRTDTRMPLIFFQDLSTLTHQAELVKGAIKIYPELGLLGHISKGLLERLQKRDLYFQLVWNKLNTRTTTKPEDVLSIFATLFGLSAAEVNRFRHPALRMKAILKTFERLPLGLLLSNFKHRKRDACNSQASGILTTDWIPTDLQGRSIASKSGWMYVEQDGFRIKALDASLRSFRHLRIFRTLKWKGNAWVVKLGENVPSLGEKGTMICFKLERLPETDCDDETHVLVVLNASAQRFANPAKAWQRGICFVECGTEAGTKSVSFLCYLSWALCPSKLAQLVNTRVRGNLIPYSADEGDILIKSSKR